VEVHSSESTQTSSRTCGMGINKYSLLGDSSMQFLISNPCSLDMPSMTPQSSSISCLMESMKTVIESLKKKQQRRLKAKVELII